MANYNEADLKMISSIEEKFGKKIDEWFKIVEKSKLEKHKQIVDYLKQDHGFTHGFANYIALKFRSADAGSVENQEDLITDQYSKGKEQLKPIYDKLQNEIQKFGKDVEIAPKKAYVSLRRKKQFAIIQPSTKERVDVGINLKAVEPTDRLEKSGSFNSMVSHRVRVTDAKQVDKELIGWLKSAYNES
ncbi:MAG: DUF4287 domain-containing protein [Melioribacteraceae bacterium]|nr:DUF4287 domain-containing protein [Melioribacteraceae bacterium]MCF8265036.1 DUF4287 domain-containing protein [Melioribacteraceae bacterium]MCF8431650.1 DUF4287 domain-containing protein [Melioribacteraceae bacterium]